MRATAKRKFLESGFRDVKDSSLSVISPLTFVFSFKHQTIFENSSEYGIPVKRAQHVEKDILAARQLAAPRKSGDVTARQLAHLWMKR